MRPEILFPFFAPVSSVKGVGPKLAPVLVRHAGPFVRDLAFLAPSGLIRRPKTTLANARTGEIQTVEVTITGFPKSPPRGPYRIDVSDDTDDLQLVFFHQIRGFAQQHPIGAQRLISGRVDTFNGRLQMTHPDYIVELQRAQDIPEFEPVYPATAEVSSRTLRKLVHAALASLPELQEWHDNSIINKYILQSFKASLVSLHTPIRDDDLAPTRPAKLRLAFDESLAHQLALKARRQFRKATPAIAILHQAKSDSLLEALPFSPTSAQLRAMSDVRRDLASGYRMNRLVQGDVGAGKTLVALVAMVDVAEAGLQSVMMAPTEILARQHFEKSVELLTSIGISCVLLTGRDKGQIRANKRAHVASGEAQIVFGTHAVFQDGVDFQALQLAVIDEQHRFGVEQRQRLFAKGNAVHYLSMSATPIPRTLALTQYGEADLSILDEKPPGRKPIHTAVLPRQRLHDVVERLRAAVSGGAQAYWICPLVIETAESDLVAVELRHRELSADLGMEIGLVHGRMASEEKDAVVAAFASGAVRVLCATTVVEVGVDVPTASIMVIEQAERFGLAQLHQLRGRVGRGSAQSTCILLYDTPLTATAKARLELLRETEDGFRLAEMDWRLRGEGDILGARQSGFPAYRFVDPVAHADIIAVSAKDAAFIVEHPDKVPPARLKALEVLKQLFDWRPDAADKQD